MNSQISQKPNFQVHKTIKEKQSTNNKPSLPKLVTNIDLSILNFPVFTYEKAEIRLQTELNIINKLLLHINNVLQQLNDINKSIQKNGNYLNMFINNICSPTPKFNFENHFLVFNELNNTLAIHNVIELDEAAVDAEINDILIEDAQDLLDLLHDKKSYKITKSQITLCKKLYDAHIELNDKYEQTNLRLESAGELYDSLVNKLKCKLLNLNPINLTTDDPPQYFEENVHELIITHINDKLVLFYTFNEYKDIFIEYIQTQLSK